MFYVNFHLFYIILINSSKMITLIMSHKTAFLKFYLGLTISIPIPNGEGWEKFFYYGKEFNTI